MRAKSKSKMPRARVPAATFDEDAERYDRARPVYPEPLFDELFALAGLKPGATVLEIGCGTGQATRPLARRGCAVTCVELGQNLAAVARNRLARFPNVEVIRSSFESWEPRGRTFDVVFAATSWHWIDPRIRYTQAASVLQRRGVLAIVQSTHVFPEGFDRFFVEIQKIYDSFGQSVDKFPRPDEISDDRENIERSGRFRNVRVKRYCWSVDYTAEQYVELLKTYSGHIILERADRAALFDEVWRLINVRPERRIRKDYLAILHVADLINDP